MKSAKGENQVPASSAEKEFITNATASNKSKRILRWQLQTCRHHMPMCFGQWIESSPIDDTITTLQYNGMLWRVPASKKRDWKCNSTDFVVRVDGDLRSIKLRDVYYSADLKILMLGFSKGCRSYPQHSVLCFGFFLTGDR